MSADLSVEARACPDQMTIRRAGAAIGRAPDGIATAPFWVEILL